MPVQIGALADASFDDPLRMLSDCHRRILSFASLLDRLAREFGGKPFDDSSRNAIAQALHYFRTSAPLHSEDEERSLFPRIESRLHPQLRTTLEELCADHRVAETRHERIEKLYRHWLSDRTLPPELVDELLTQTSLLLASYRSHIETEDRKLFPAAKSLLSPEEIAAIGQELAQRRGL